MCDNTVDEFLPELKFVSNSSVINKMIKKLYNASFADDDDILFFDEDSGTVTFSSDRDNINTDDVNFYEKILKLLFMSQFWVGMIDLNNAKHLEIK